MSTCTHESMINHHGQGLFAKAFTQLSETLHVWHQRYETRRELAQWSERDLHDIGKSWSDVAHEAEKPFWRA
ncbi:DUF1127 domain-containing protein [Bradyrhizobium sp. 31Argb]|uniref:DUF1127 domain-containing protein n=1 Tax=unclassified Bradyrhizobium TaxID=2631580 RepID=UPI00102E9E1C|nr:MULTISPECIES: DUF1127 domain-containing protein [unclassified Bradyrhizobium]MDI4235318.1 DUF1127 domain-containing protein [Bradyrhizobium sp. Arg237L]TAI66245.1 hypothetical protein CWO89_09010 [Bradyrhizobium sp. Leo170]